MDNLAIKQSCGIRLYSDRAGILGSGIGIGMENTIYFHEFLFCKAKTGEERKTICVHSL